MISQEDLSLVGLKAYLPMRVSLSPLVVIKEIRERWGNLDCKVTPVAGEGEAWVARSSLTICLEEREKIIT